MKGVRGLLAPSAAMFVLGWGSFASAQVQKFSDSALEDVSRAGKSVDLILFMANQPAGVVGRAVRERYEPQLEAYAEHARSISRAQLQRPSLSPEQERSFIPRALNPREERERSAALLAVDTLQNQMIDEIVRSVQPLVSFEQLAMRTLIESFGGRVRGTTLVMNALAVTVPVSHARKLASHPGIAWIESDHAGVPELDNHRLSLGLETGFWLNGFTGGVHDVGVLDTGVQQNHPAFVGHRFESNAGTTDSDGHGTGIAGIMGSRNGTYPGMAWGCDTICVARAGADSTSMSGMNYLMVGTTEKPENVNYSFGNGTANDTDYSAFDRFFDAVIDTFGVTVSKSTGNGGWGTTTITHPAPAYNLLASANMDDRNTVTRADDIITSSSSRGPTLGGRKKPDITAPGTNSMTTNRTGTFSNLGGTSSASPHTGGGTVLLRQLGLTDPRSIKAVLLNAADAWDDNGTSTTADDGPYAGSKWTKTFGWGYLDLGEAYLNGTDVFLRDMAAPAAGSRNFKLFKGQMFANEKATLVWNRHVAYNGAAYPSQFEGLSNLDLAAWRQTDNALLSSSVSTIDNVEQIDVPSDAQVVLKVSTTGVFDPDVASERYGLATEENFTEADGPAFSLGWTHPSTVAPGASFQVSVTVTNDGDVPAHGNTVLLGGATVTSGANPQPLPTIPPGESRTATWTVQAPASPGTMNLTAAQTSNSYGETFVRNGASTVQVSQDVVLPTGFTVTRGLLDTGVLSDLFEEDGSRLACKFDPAADLVGAQIQVEVTGTSPTDSPSALDVVLRASAEYAGVWQTMELWDSVASQWVEVDARFAATSDATVVASAPAPVARFVRTSDREIRARYSWQSLAVDSGAPWKIWIDQAVWLLP